MEDSTNSTNLEKECISKANHLIYLCSLDAPQINSVEDFNSAFFVLLFNSICGAPLPDLIYPSTTPEIEAHNVQMVIDTLSLDLLCISLSHITGEDIVNGNIMAIHNFLEILEGCTLCFSKPITKTLPQSQKGDLKAKDKDANITQDWVCPSCGNKEQLEKLVCTLAENHNYSCPICECSFSMTSSDLNHALNQTSKTQISEESAKSVEVDNSKNGLMKKASSSSHSSIIVETADKNIESKPSYVVPESIVNEAAMKTIFSILRTDFPLDSLTKVKTVISNTETISSQIAEKSGIMPSDKIKQSTSAQTSFTPTHPLKTDDTVQIVSSSSPKSSSNIQSSTFNPSNAIQSSSTFNTQSTSSITSSSTLSSSSFCSKLKDLIYEFENTNTPKRKLNASFVDSSKEDQQPQKYDRLLKKRKMQDTVTEKDHEDLTNLHGKNLETKIRLFVENGLHHRIRAAEIHKRYQDAIRPCKQTKQSLPVCRRSYLLPWFMRKESYGLKKARITKHNQKPSVKQSQKAFDKHVQTSSQTHVQLSSTSELNSNSEQNKERNEEPNALLQEIYEDFPDAQVSSNFIQNLSDKYQNHLLTMYKNILKTLSKKTPTHIQAEEAIKRQQALAKLLNKDLKHIQNLNQIKEHRNLAQQVRSKNRDENMNLAKMKQYYDIFWKDLQKKIQQRHYEDEKIIKEIFTERMNLEKEQIQSLTQQYQDRENNNANYHKNYLDALENFYKTQFELWAESAGLKDYERRESAKAQQKVLQNMKRTFRQQTENNVKEMQDKLIRKKEELMKQKAERGAEKMRKRFSGHTPVKKM